MKIKCWNCGREMENTIGGCYRCKHCGIEIHDAVFRPRVNALDDLTVNGTSEQKSYQQGWVCPKCGGVYSPSQTFCPHCTPAKPIKWTCDTGNPNTPTGQSISSINETHSNHNQNIQVFGNGIDTSDRMNNFK